MLRCLVAFSLTMVRATAPVGSVPMRVVNNAGASIELFWNDVFSAKEPGEDLKLVKQTTKPIRNSSDTTINSYDTHEFVIRFYKHIDGVQAFFAKGPMEEVVTVSYDPETKTMSTVQRTKIDDVMDKVKAASNACGDLEGDKYADCISNIVIQDISKITESKDLIASYRDIMSERLRNYICQDDLVNSTEATKTSSFFDSEQTKSSYVVSTLMDSDNSKIWYVDNFLTEAECEALKGYHTSHAAQNIEKTISVSQFELSNKKSPYASHFRELHRRISALYSHQTHTSKVSPDGQEDIYTYQYAIGGESPSQCDHRCLGEFTDSGDRVATALLFCGTPSQGGVTVFPKSDIIVKAKPYSALLINYVGADGRLDEGFAERSECPVTQGEKFQGVIHLRFDVSLDRPWHTFTQTALDSAGDADSSRKTTGAPSRRFSTSKIDDEEESNGDDEL